MDLVSISDLAGNPKNDAYELANQNCLRCRSNLSEKVFRLSDIEVHDRLSHSYSRPIAHWWDFLRLWRRFQFLTRFVCAIHALIEVHLDNVWLLFIPQNLLKLIRKQVNVGNNLHRLTYLPANLVNRKDLWISLLNDRWRQLGCYLRVFSN
jgi:hypothetical protein